MLILVLYLINRVKLIILENLLITVTPLMKSALISAISGTGKDNFDISLKYFSDFQLTLQHFSPLQCSEN